MFRTGLSVFAFLLPALLTGQDQIRLNSLEYFEAPGFAFLPFHNDYLGGHQGGLQLIQNGERLLDSGNLYLDPATPTRILRRTVDAASQTATVFGEITELKTGYRLVCRTDGAKIFVTLQLDQPVGRAAGLRFTIYPGEVYGKSFIGDGGTGVFPHQFTGNPLLLDKTTRLRIAPESSGVNLLIARTDGSLSLMDTRRASPQPWFSIQAPVSGTEVRLVITPSMDPAWRKPPVLGVSQVGYMPRQVKQAVLELDPRDTLNEPAHLYQMTLDDSRKLVKSATPKPWGRFLRWQYAVFDFTDVTPPGLYVLEYRGQTAGPFRIADDAFAQAWQPALAYFLPIQMCHVAVKEGSRTWHGACHLDDARQAPAGKRYIDGYQQGERETRFADNEHIPGLDWGGWHDAGDHDLPAGSLASTTLPLALAYEEFAPQLDDVTVKRESREVLLHAPDGKSDFLQQVEFGVEGMLASYRIAGYIFPGIIESTGRQYGHLGDPVNVTDNKNCRDPTKDCDDRWVFTNRNTGLQYQVAQTLALSSRVLKSFNPALAAESLAASRKLFDDEQSRPPVYAPNSYVPRDSGFRVQEIAAAAELFLTTGDARYRTVLLSREAEVKAMPARLFGDGPGYTLVRAMDKVNDASFRAVVVEKAKAWQAECSKLAARSPYGVPWPETVGAYDGSHTIHVWGLGWNFQNTALRQYYFVKHLPDVFDPALLYSVVNFVLGVHPASNESYVSGVGARSPLIAYGTNRADWSHIPGGVISGASLVRPDFMELKRFPFLWYQTEYVIHGASTYIFDVLAAQKLLQK